MKETRLGIFNFYLTARIPLSLTHTHTGGVGSPVGDNSIIQMFTTGGQFPILFPHVASPTHEECPIPAANTFTKVPILYLITTDSSNNVIWALLELQRKHVRGVILFFLSAG